MGSIILSNQVIITFEFNVWAQLFYETMKLIENNPHIIGCVLISRPYISSSKNNTDTELTHWHNSLARLFGHGHDANLLPTSLL
jgi:hypothetical protein